MAILTATAASSVTDSSAQLNGTANPQGVGIFAWFEYGLTTSYGSSTSHVYVGNGAVPVAVSADVSGLIPGRTYHYRVAAEPGSVPPPGTYGFDLPDRLPESAGTTHNVSSVSALSSALSSAANGDIINITANLNGGGAQFAISRVASAGAPLTITADPGVLITNFSQWYVTGQYLRFRDLDVSGCALAGIKFDGNANNNEIDHCHIHDNTRMGILVYCVTPPDNIQLWNNTIHDNGSTANAGLDHGIYFGTAAQNGSRRCVVANNLVYFNCAFNVQLYPNVPGILATCNTMDDHYVHANAQSGIVVGSANSSAVSVDATLVGLLSTNALHYAIQPFFAGVGTTAYDTLGYGNAGGDFPADTNMTYVNCTHADPLYVNRAARDYHLQAGSPAIDYVDPARYGLVPPFDIDGNPRVTADAGCYAA